MLIFKKQSSSSLEMPRYEGDQLSNPLTGSHNKESHDTRFFYLTAQRTLPEEQKIQLQGAKRSSPFSPNASPLGSESCASALVPSLKPGFPAPATERTSFLVGSSTLICREEQKKAE
jgi:hypothetical protein